MTLRLFNTLGRKAEPFRAVGNKAGIFTCGPSIYQQAHIGNWRTFLFEDILVRFLEYLGHPVWRGMNITDIEDKAVTEAKKRHTTVRKLTDANIRKFLGEMRSLRMKKPDYLPRASEHVDGAVRLIERLLARKIAYWHRGNVYFDPLRCRGFGKLFGLDMKKWPKKRRRFHRDTYPGIQWNRGDFILWHGHRQCDTDCWDTRIGKGRPSWNIQDPSMIMDVVRGPLAVYCGGIDNLYRHHDYTIAILESVRPFPMARFWLHGEHLFVDGKKMSKSLGNIVYTDDLIRQGYSHAEIRYFLISGHYREKQNYTEEAMREAALCLRELRRAVSALRRKAGTAKAERSALSAGLLRAFEKGMNNDLNVKEALRGVSALLGKCPPDRLVLSEAAGVVKALRRIDSVLQVLL